eukprot:ANDGO_05738.mRNA.1 hypothetical protein
MATTTKKNFNMSGNDIASTLHDMGATSLTDLNSSQAISCNLWKRVNPLWLPEPVAPHSVFKQDMEDALNSGFKEKHDFTHHRRRDGFTHFVEANARFTAMNKLQATQGGAASPKKS